MFDIKNLVIGALLILKKYTIINIPYEFESCNDDYSFGIFLLPILGLLIGIFSIIISATKILYNPMFSGVLMLIYYCIITKCTNIKETYKTFDVILKFRGYNEQVIRVVGIVLMCILYFVLFTISSIRAIVLMPMIGFSNLLVSSYLIKRNKEFTSVLVYCKKEHALFAFVFSFAIVALVNYKLTISLSATYVLSMLIVNYIDNNIKILPLSFEGTLIEFTQLLFLILSYMFYIV